MKVFLSWSGARSKTVAEILANWILEISHTANLRISPYLHGGAQWKWEREMASLKDAKIGIVCLTRENLNDRRILFDSGVLATMRDSYVFTFLLDVPPSDVEHPLSLFRHTKFDRCEIRELVRTINRACAEEGERSLGEKTLNEIFDASWPRLDVRLKQVAVPIATPSDNDPHQRAIKLTDRFLSGLGSAEPRPAHMVEEIETSDVEATVDRFSLIFRVVTQLGASIPCVDFGENGKVPIDFLPTFPPYSLDPRFYSLALRYEGIEALFKSNSVVFAAPDEAEGFFRAGLVRFLRSRFRAGRESPSQAPSKGLPFKVYTKGEGDRVHYTFSQLINTNPVFGAPTSPVAGYMKPGVWKFGIWRNDGVILDPADFDIPAVTEAHLIV